MEDYKNKIKTPLLATDGIIKLFDKDEIFQGIVLIERKNPPLGFAIPGGFVDVGEKVEDALKREMKEEVTLDVQIEKLLGVYSDPKRDERFHCVSCTYICKAYGTPKAADDAKNLQIYKLEDIPFDKLAFDHAKILKEFLQEEANLF
ncbi:NUDIX hydrolase [Malaciobacter molluscorum LMG 25693]|uniref:ADP-ribose pyrophosphatase YjhB, Nudix family n=1 Tax=Malaciobacter molluscorum LMG 25693 TaxID=870501 RepID=A0A2G1DEU8_9BACT|nr:NUDIX hydrolase [Malaciobacter molluscorum]AXX93072.1 putative ADP-ribose pyrophosphatase YjhB, Nudix family [Malaciobacter molluscorum LMG 25693]PHO16960.1 NUDIX hydrolase [Malaciobacter molluscorum LMG 25693]RXJ95542.1 NUDIX hydrolase [Malaciobacter molluscorum]